MRTFIACTESAVFLSDLGTECFDPRPSVGAGAQFACRWSTFPGWGLSHWI